MTPIKILVTIFTLLLPILSLSQTQQFEVSGTLSGDFHGRIYMFFDGNYRQRDSISSEIRDGKFYFKASANLPIQARFHLDQTSFIEDVYIDSKKTYLSCTNKMKPVNNGKDTLNNFMVTRVEGSETERLKTDFENWLARLRDSGKPENEINNSYYSQLFHLVQAHPDSKVSAYLIGKASALSFQQVEQLYALLSNNLKNTFEGKTVSALLKKLANEANSAAGKPFWDVVLKDTLGRNINTKDLRGKYVLVEFWASWCGPCRRDNPKVKKLYDKLGGKDFEIIGVSLDHDKEKWKAAIVKDKLNWKHVIDEKGELAMHYAIESIPNNLLLDKDGKIIDGNLSLENVEEILTKRNVTAK